MKKKSLLLIACAPLCLSSCYIFNGVKEFGDARVTADYFLKDYTDFFYYGEKDYVCVARASDKVIKGDYVSAINGKRCTSYRFYSFGNYEQSDYLVVNKYNKVFKINEDYIYASKDAPGIPFEFLFFPYKIQDPEWVTVGSNLYICYGESFQFIEKGEEVLKNDYGTYCSVKDYENWIMKSTENTTKLYYLDNMPTFDVNIAWLVKEITVKWGDKNVIRKIYQLR